MIIDLIKDFTDEDFNDEKISQLSISKLDVLDELKLIYNTNSEIDYTLYDSLIIKTISMASTNQHLSPFSERTTLTLGYLNAKGVDFKYTNLLLYLVKTPGELLNLILPLVENEKPYQILIEEYNRYLKNTMSYLHQQEKLLKEDVELSKEQYDQLTEALQKFANNLGVK